MDRVDSADYETVLGKRQYTDGSAPLTPATVLASKWLNAVQEELLKVVEDAGLTPSHADVTQLRQALDVLYGKIDDGGWTALPLNTGGNWSAPADETTVYQPKYRKDSYGRVWLRGRAVRTSGSAGTIGTLPSGYRPSPSAGMFFPVLGQSGGVLGAVQVAGSGALAWVVGDPGGASDVQLDGIVFYTT